MSVLRNPVTQFLVAGFLMLAVVVFATGRLSSYAAAEEAVADARMTTEILARSVAQPAIPSGLVDGAAAAVDRLDRYVLRRLLVEDVRRIKIWSSDGTILYSDKTQLIGSSYTLGADERQVLRDGGTDAEVSDLGRPENRFERSSGGMLEVYTRVRSPEGEPLLFEVYYSSADLTARREDIFSSFRPISLGGLTAIVLFTTPLLWVLTRRLDRAARAREHLLRAAVEASEAERRRIARDLHDGVVQDLAGTAFALSATARDASTSPETADRLRPLAASLRKSLRSLRSLLVEIYPPDLDAQSLPAALDDLVAPAAGASVHASVRVAEVASASREAVALVWRVAQEAVRNALRHSQCRNLSVDVQGVDDRLVLTVADDGVGISAAGSGAPHRCGLRGLHDLVRESGGTLHIDSGPARGTTVHLEVAAR